MEENNDCLEVRMKMETKSNLGCIADKEGMEKEDLIGCVLDVAIPWMKEIQQEGFDIRWALKDLWTVLKEDDGKPISPYDGIGYPELGAMEIMAKYPEPGITMAED